MYCIYICICVCICVCLKCSFYPAACYWPRFTWNKQTGGPCNCSRCCSVLFLCKSGTQGILSRGSDTEMQHYYFAPHSSHVQRAREAIEMKHLKSQNKDNTGLLFHMLTSLQDKAWLCCTRHNSCNFAWCSQSKSARPKQHPLKFPKRHLFGCAICDDSSHCRCCCLWCCSDHPHINVINIIWNHQQHFHACKMTPCAMGKG